MKLLLVKYLAKITLPAILLINFSISIAQLSPPPGTKTFGLGYDDRGSQIIPTDEGGYLFLGTLNNLETYSEDMWLVKLDFSGEIIWQQIYGGGGSERGYCILEVSTGGFLLAGCTTSYGEGGYDAWLVKIDSTGGIDWQKTYGNSLDDYPFYLIPGQNDGFVIAGTTTDTLLGKFDLWAFKIDSEGNVEWETIMGDFDQDQIRSIQQTSDGGYITAGYTVQDLETRYDLWLVKLSSEGDSLWSKIYGGYERDVAQSVQVLSGDSLLVMGYNESITGDKDIWILKTDPQGNIINSTTFGGEYPEYGHILNKSRDGNFLITGYTESFGAVGWDLLMLKVDSEGNAIGSKTYGGDGQDFGHDFYQDENGGYVCLGITDSYGAGGWDAWMIWTDSLEQTIPPADPAPSIKSITDIPSDQGGWVNLEFYKCQYDTDTLVVPKSGSAELYTVEINDGSGWKAAASTAAYGKELYTIVVPTPKDSTHKDDGLLDFRVIAAMEEGNFVSDVVSGYSVDNLSPKIPSGVGGVITEESNLQITWEPNSEADLGYYIVYRSQDEINFDESGQTDETTFIDSEVIAGVNYSYSVTAVDTNGNESDYSDIVTLSVSTVESRPDIPVHYYLTQNFPNPFNPQTTIKYGLLKAGEVRVIIYDVLGNIVKFLINQNQPRGHYQVIWNGVNTQNEQVSSGIYYYQIITDDFQDVKKMFLIR
jgi:hypothetical protein